MISLPSDIGNLKALKEREKKAFDSSAQWHSTLSDAYDYFLPQRNIFDDESKGQKKMDKIFDSTSLIAIQQGASKLQESVAPIWARWATYGLSGQAERMLKAQDVGVSENEIREKLEERAEITFDYINRSNFATQFYEFALDLLIGTGTLRVDEQNDNDNPIVFTAVVQKGVAFEEGSSGTVEGHFVQHKVKARLIERMWPGFEASHKMQNLIDDKPDEEVNISQACIYSAKDKLVYAVVWVKDEEKISWVEKYNTSPFVTGRYAKCSGETRGRGPALQCLPDVMSLNKAKEFVLQKAAIDLAGMYTATDDGVMNPYNFRVSPGLVLPVGSNNTSNPSIMRLDTGNDLALAQFEIIELQNAIKTTLFNDLRDPEGPVRTATEIAIDARELAKRIGSAFGRLQTEVLIPILKRVDSILVRRGLLESVEIGGKEIDIKFTSPLARAQDAEDLLSVQQAVEFTLATAGPDQTKMAYKLEDFGTWAGEKTGMPSELIRSESEKKQIIQAGAQAAQAQMEAGNNGMGQPTVQ